MNILLVTPFKKSYTRGNFITVQRWYKGLTARNFKVVLSSPESLESEFYDNNTFIPDLIHAHHAVYSGPTALSFSRKYNIPLVISAGGTDIHSEKNGEPDIRCLDSLQHADAIILPFNESILKFKTILPASPPVFVVRRGASVIENINKISRIVGLTGVVVGGLRPVKGQLRALHLAETLRQKGVPVSVKLVGPVIEDRYAESIKQRLSKQKEDEWVGAVDHDRMNQIYTHTDFLLNTSDHEGASNAILEAMANGRPVAARKCPGNEELLSSAAPDIACLFEENDSGIEKLSRWLNDLLHQTVEERNLIAGKTQDYVRLNFNEQDEINELVRVYHNVLNQD